MKKYTVTIEIETHDILDDKDGIETAEDLKEMIELETYGQIKVVKIEAKDTEGLQKEEVETDFGWDCETSPTRKCDYYNPVTGDYDEDCCIYCGEPYERK